MPAAQPINYYTEDNGTAQSPLLYMFTIAAVAVIVIGLSLALYRANTQRKIIGAVLIVFAALSYGALYFTGQNFGVPAPVFAPKTMLASLWGNYKYDTIEPASGRTIDRSIGSSTTSEAEGYTMLRAVLMDDEPAFAASWKWTKQNLQRQDGIFSWLYGVHANGQTGILTERGGQNSATDADTDIAVSL